jgi:hypothetical protein
MNELFPSEGGFPQESSMKKQLIVIFTLAAIILTLSSCGPRVIGTGIIVWSTDEESLPSGSDVEILTESDLRDSYNIRYYDPEGRDQYIEIERWRLARAANRNELEELRQRYEPWAPYFGVAEIQALPVRQFMATDPTSAIVYRLREGERVKIIDRTPEEVEVGGLMDYWFEIITENGTVGYVFGYRLDVVDAQGVSTEKQEQSDDEFLSAILNYQWRPDYYAWMIADGNYDLSRFRSEYRFQHDAAAKTFTLVTEEFNRVFAYEEIFQARYKEYVASGSSLQMSAYNDRNISIQFNIDGQTYQQSLVRIDADIDEVIENEIERRRQRLEDFVAQGRILSSDSYGTITLAENGSLDWQRYGSLGSGMVPGWFTGSAQLSFSLYISKDLTVNYEGVLSMTQPGRGISASMNFFYRFANGGLQLEYVPPQNISRNVVIRQALSPFIMFFNVSD